MLKNLCLLFGAWMMCTVAAAAVDQEGVGHAAHDAYVAAINSNDVQTLLADLTDDVVYQAPGEPEIVGKSAVKTWITAYFAVAHTHWVKTSLSFTMNGDWAFERYRYESSDTDRKSGAVSRDAGKGINIFRRGTDGRWRVAIDSWSSDRAAAP